MITSQPLVCHRMPRFLRILGLLAPILAFAGARPNVLFIGVDDLSIAAVQAYTGNSVPRTPHLDALAAEGVRFDRAYAQQALCAPSRLSLMTGLSPDSLGIYDLKTTLREAHPDALTLPQYFRKHGYYATRRGKIFHEDSHDDPLSWSESGDSITSYDLYAYASGEAKAFIAQREREAEEQGMTGFRRYAHTRGPTTDTAERPDSAFEDGRMTDELIGMLSELKEREEPFFLAAGYHKPHLPFVAPRRYWDLYDRDAFALPTSTRPEGAPSFAFHPWWELRTYHGVPKKGPLTEDETRKLLHGYYAATSFVDAQIGRLLDALEAEGLADDTIVVLWSDHGYHLGEMELWNKHTVWEQALRVPLIVRAPGVDGGAATDGLVGLVDLFPTLCQLADLPIPEDLDGRSFAPLLHAPELPWMPAVYSQYPKGGLENPERMAYSLRTAEYRFNAYVDLTSGETYARELYDLREHPEAPSQRNLALDEAHSHRVEALEALLRQGFPTLSIQP